MASDRARRYGAVAIALHWLVAAAILFQVSLAWRMHDLEGPAGFALVQLHKSVGISILAVSLLRLVWRLAHPPPALPASLAPWERRLARAAHAGFYVAMIGLPLTGWIMVSSSRLQIPTLLYGVVPWPDLPGMAGASRAMWHEIGEVGHEILAWGVYGLFALHVAGALRHQLFGRDAPVLARMAPGARAGRWLEPRLAAIALGAAAALVAAWTIRPPDPGVAVPPDGADHDHGLAAAPTPAETRPPAQAAPSPASTAAPAPAAPAGWRVERGSTLGFETAWSETPVRGRFERWTADVRFSPDALDRARVSVSVDVASAVTGDAQRDSALAAPDWLDAAAHPTATFTATRFERTGEHRFVAHGRLQLRGVSRPLSLPFRLQIDGDKARVRGVTSLDRTAFGVGQGEWKSTDQIPAKVTLRVDLRATRR